MASTTFGASIVPTAADDKGYKQLPHPHHLDSPALTPAVSRDGSPAASPQPQPKISIPIQSPFYEHPPASHEALPAHSRQNSKEGFTSTLVLEKDLESGLHSPLTPAVSGGNPFANSQISVNQHNKECTMWPSRQTLMQNKQVQKQQRRDGKGWQGCAPLHNWWAKYNKRQRLYIKLALAVFLAGVVIAIGVGISVAVDGSVYATNGGSHPIQH